jgi:hypothetical protein
MARRPMRKAASFIPDPPAMIRHRRQRFKTNLPPSEVKRGGRE